MEVCETTVAWPFSLVLSVWVKRTPSSRVRWGPVRYCRGKGAGEEKAGLGAGYITRDESRDWSDRRAGAGREGCTPGDQDWVGRERGLAQQERKGEGDESMRSMG